MVQNQHKIIELGSADKLVMGNGGRKEEGNISLKSTKECLFNQLNYIIVKIMINMMITELGSADELVMGGREGLVKATKSVLINV
ncbi:hypothetical protein Cyrtocomes_00525 [Candidatus Cyrtobacter comes]|uniref:Uncharacterized protein n=1 Tax=Candidatus Cyrtobacter comes TaxID=675776 RepID=A0ABU5L7Q5_9RICK|nr:hypothetical protein [Candidatus Cyrtobacter comes]MDZ5762154.1 hypothetical protein [Candidatus Cyrtobacter comes]